MSRINHAEGPDINGLQRGHRVNAAALADDLGLIAQSAPHSIDGLRNLQGLLEYLLEGIEAEIERREDDESDPASQLDSHGRVKEQYRVGSAYDY